LGIRVCDVWPPSVDPANNPFENAVLIILQLLRPEVNATIGARERIMSETRLSFKEMCAKFDVTPRTLRYYEYIELLTPEKEGRSRFYGAKELARMTLILRGRRFGFSLEDIRQWLMIYENEGTEAQMREWVALADRQMVELEEQQQQLQETMSELKNLRDITAKTLA
jgi:DNA-binding transcriptional MerR regulator